MRLIDVSDAFLVDMVGIGEGCPEGCMHCGAYPEGVYRGHYNEISPEKLRSNLDMEIGTTVDGTRMNLIDLFNDYVTTDVNIEPLRGEAFPYLAELVYELSSGQKQVVCISHGIRWKGKRGTNNKPSLMTRKMKGRLRKIVGLMEKGVVPLIVLTVDCARDGGKISYEENKRSYLETMKILRPILTNGWGRLTVSIQGEDGAEAHPLYRAKAICMFNKVLQELGLSSDEYRLLNFDQSRVYACVGRASSLPGLDREGACDVIPDADFAKFYVKFSPLRGRVGKDGVVEWQYRRSGRGYNDTVDGVWQRFDNGDNENNRVKPFEIPDSDIDWLKQLSEDGDIFRVWPLSLVEQKDREKVLFKVYGRLSGVSIVDVMGEGGVFYKDVKKLILKWLLPMELVWGRNEGDFYEKEVSAAESLIFDSSPYGKYHDSLSFVRRRKLENSEVEYNYLIGEIIALASLLDTECGLSYVLRKISKLPGWNISL